MKVFVAYDFHIRGGLVDAIDSVMRNPPQGMTMEWTGAPGTRSQGDLWKHVVEPGIREADRVVAFVDLPNANVGFEIGYALGLGKSVAITRCRKQRPDWLNLSPLNGVLCEQAETTERLRDILVRGENDWIRTSPTTSNGNNVLFLCPIDAPYVEQKPLSWILPEPEGWGITDLTDLFQHLSQIVWVVAPHHLGPDARDGDENAALSVIAGYAAAIPGVRLEILVHHEARNVADVVIHRRLFRDNDELSTRFNEIEESCKADVIRTLSTDSIPNKATQAPELRAANPIKVTPRRLIYERVPVQGFLAFDDLPNPYEHLRDATDPRYEQPTIFGYLWFPHTQYIESRSLQDFTPAAIVCSINPDAVVEELKRRIGESGLRKFSIPPRDLRNQEKCLLLHEMGSVLDDCFEIAVTFPKLGLEVGHTKPEIAYDVMIHGFLLPFVQMHQRLGFDHFCLGVSSVGRMDSALLARVKRVFRVCYSRANRGIKVDFVSNDTVSATMASMARLFAWTVGTLHNTGNPKWISLLEDSVEMKNRGSSHLEEPH